VVVRVRIHREKVFSATHFMHVKVEHRRVLRYDRKFGPRLGLRLN
jgi:hypothetical protein